VERISFEHLMNFLTVFEGIIASEKYEIIAPKKPPVNKKRGFKP